MADIFLERYYPAHLQRLIWEHFSSAYHSWGGGQATFFRHFQEKVGPLYDLKIRFVSGGLYSMPNYPDPVSLKNYAQFKNRKSNEQQFPAASNRTIQFAHLYLYATKADLTKSWNSSLAGFESEVIRGVPDSLALIDAAEIFPKRFKLNVEHRASLLDLFEWYKTSSNTKNTNDLRAYLDQLLCVVCLEPTNIANRYKVVLIDQANWDYVSNSELPLDRENHPLPFLDPYSSVCFRALDFRHNFLEKPHIDNSSHWLVARLYNNELGADIFLSIRITEDKVIDEFRIGAPSPVNTTVLSDMYYKGCLRLIPEQLTAAEDKLATKFCKMLYCYNEERVARGR